MKLNFRSVFNTIHLIGIILAGIFLASQLTIVSINVVLRYFFNSGISWVEEIARDVLMPAFTFLAMAIGVKLDTHINVDLIPRRAPAWLSLALTKLKYAIMTVIGFILVYFGLVLIGSLRGSIASLPSLPISLQFIMLPLGGLLIFIDSGMNLLGLEKEDHFLDAIFMSAGEQK